MALFAFQVWATSPTSRHTLELHTTRIIESEAEAVAAQLRKDGFTAEVREVRIQRPELAR